MALTRALPRLRVLQTSVRLFATKSDEGRFVDEVTHTGQVSPRVFEARTFFLYIHILHTCKQKLLVPCIVVWASVCLNTNIIYLFTELWSSEVTFKYMILDSHIFYINTFRNMRSVFLVFVYRSNSIIGTCACLPVNLTSTDAALYCKATWFILQIRSHCSVFIKCI